MEILIFDNDGNADANALIDTALELGAKHYTTENLTLNNFGQNLKFSDVMSLKFGGNPKIFEKRRLSKEEEREIDANIIRSLRFANFTENTTGYPYLFDAIKLCVLNDWMIYSVTKELYPTIAKKYSTTPQCVEHAIRKSIQIAWETCSNKNRFSGSPKRPTNSKFIASVAHSVRNSVHVKL